MIARPLAHLAAIAKRYPMAWREMDEFRAARGREGFRDWPDWCWLPIAGSVAIATRGRSALPTGNDVQVLAALGAWRATKGIYRFDPALYEPLRNTDLSSEIPVELLFQMPEWGLYMETPHVHFGDHAVHGAFAHLEHDLNTGKAELRLLLDTPDHLVPLILHLDQKTIGGALEAALREAEWQAKKRGMARPFLGEMPSDWLVETQRGVATQLTALLLFICTQAGDIGDGHRPSRPVPTKTKSGPRIFPPDEPRKWDVGVRLGAALRRAYQALEVDGRGVAGERSAPRAHIRRAHYHTYWLGPRDRPQASLRWLPPIAVNVEDIDALPATVRPV